MARQVPVSIGNGQGLFYSGIGHALQLDVAAALRGDGEAETRQNLDGLGPGKAAQFRHKRVPIPMSQ